MRCVLLLGGAIISVSFAKPARVAVAARPPNVILIVVDDLGWADLGCYGADLHETPNIDALARQGMRFTDAYAASPICSPTRASIMTGKYPARLRMTIWYEASQEKPPSDRLLVPPRTRGNLPLGELTIAEKLRDRGYLTAHIGKWHLGDAAHYPEVHGFDLNIGGTFWGAPSMFFYPYRGRWSRSEEIRYVPHLEFGHEGEYLTDRLTDEALRVIQRAGEKPFFLHLAYHSVHTPIEAPGADVERFAAKVQPGLNHQNPTYAAMVASVDRNVGRVLTKLAETGNSQDTIVLLTSDNGGFINVHRGQRVTNNSPLRSGKGSLYEGGVRVPLIVRWLGVTPAGTQCTEPVVSTDLHATVDVMTDPDGKNLAVDGLSLAPLLEDPQTSLDREAIYFHYPHYYPTTTPVGAVRAGKWKLLEYFEDRRIELYNLESDVGEQTNLAKQHADVAHALREKLHTWRNELNAQMPQPNKDATP